MCAKFRKHILLNFNSELSYNYFDNLPVPNSGWPHLRQLYLQDVYSLYEAPTPSDVPELELGFFTYSYHCCAFESHVQAKNNTFVGVSNIIHPGPIEVDIDTDTFTPSPSLGSADITEVCKHFKDIVPLPPICLLNGDDDDDDGDDPIIENFNRTEIILVARNERHIPERGGQLFICHPYSDKPMTPCKDLFGSWVLRILIWLLFIVIMFGNGVVLMLILGSLKSACRTGDQKMPHFFIFQLAMADIGVGIYLGFLAVVDLKTFGQHNFYHLALSWQHGPGCLAAGFIAIFSLELSIYILVMMTLERVYIHTYGLEHVEMKLWNVIIVVLIGWLFAATCASLPLIGYNSYSSVAICLPLDIVSTSGRYYIVILMGINLLIFLLLSSCNLYIFCRIRQANTNAFNKKMFRIILILIFTDFLCWAPLVVVSLAALSDQDLINTNATKWFAVLVLPINACANPFLYALLTEKFRQQVVSMYHNAKKVTLSCRRDKTQPQQGNSNPLEGLSTPGSDSDQNSSGSLSNGSTVLDDKVPSGSLHSVTNPMLKEDCASNSLSLGSPLHDTGEGDSTSITSFSIDAASTTYNSAKDDGHELINVCNAKLNSQVAVEETDI